MLIGAALGKESWETNSGTSTKCLHPTSRTNSSMVATNQEKLAFPKHNGRRITLLPSTILHTRDLPSTTNSKKFGLNTTP
jgi:hypothetical protein